MKKNTHCSFCGEAFATDMPYPRECGACKNVTYVNPIPVSVILLPVDEGLLLIRRTIPPREGTLNLPGGYINVGESWQNAAVRELEEETGITIPVETVTLFDVHSAPDGTVLIFGIAEPVRKSDLPAFSSTNETSELAIIDQHEELGFPLHTKVAERFWQERTS